MDQFSSEATEREEFTEPLRRLKAVLRLSQDQQVAELLGMSKSAFSQRKRTGGSFPVDELCRFAVNHPELGLDVNWIVGGQSSGAAAQRATYYQHLQEPAAAPQAPHVAEPVREYGRQVRHAAEVRHGLRKHLYEHLLDLADHCSDEQLRLLLDLAEQFGRAGVAAGRIGAVPATPDEMAKVG